MNGSTVAQLLNELSLEGIAFGHLLKILSFCHGTNPEVGFNLSLTSSLVKTLGFFVVLLENTSYSVVSILLIFLKFLWNIAPRYGGSPLHNNFRYLIKRKAIRTSFLSHKHTVGELGVFYRTCLHYSITCSYS